MNNFKASICTLGCRVNKYESDAICEKLRSLGFQIVPFGEKCDVSIVNTCTVTGEGDRKSRQHVRRAKAASPDGYVIVTGCFAQASPEEAEKLGADAVVGNADKDRIDEIALSLVTGRKYSGSVGSIDNAAYDSLTISTPERARSYIKIEDGCENKCAYCIIPKARGRVRSKPSDIVCSEAAAIAAAGCTEVILTGIETASYGKDLHGDTFTDLIEKVAEVPGIQRIAFGSLEPTALTPDFCKRVSALPQVLPHFHLSVQSGCTRTLNRMRRKYNSDAVLRAMETMRSFIPEVTFSADVICGFPGETDDDFEESSRLLVTAGFLHLHIFPYSIRKGTEAAQMPDQVPEDIKRKRVKELSAMQKAAQNAFLDKYISEHRTSPVYVLGEKWENGVTNGHTEHFVECEIATEADCTGKILPVLLTGRTGSVLRAAVLSDI